MAIKVILDAERATDHERHRFVREALVLARLEHPNIVPIHELGHDAEGRLFYAMKLVKGRTLQAILEGLEAGDSATVSHYTLDRLLTIFRKVCDAIGFAHHHGVVHRDLKPENVMVGEFGEVLVMDWGLAKILNDEEHSRLDGAGVESVEGFRELSESQLAAQAENLTMEGAVMGSPLYMPPEQAEGRVAEIGPHSDIYSLGGILYTILTLRTPVGGRKLREVLDNVKSGNITPPIRLGGSKSKGRKLSGSKIADPGDADVDRLPHCPRGKVPAALSTVTMRSMARETADRYASTSALAADVEKYQGGFSTSVEQLSFVGQLLLLIKRNRALSTCLFAAALATCYLSFNLLLSSVEAERVAGVDGQLYGTKMRLLPELWLRNELPELSAHLYQTKKSPLRGWEWYYWQRQQAPYRYLLERRDTVLGVAISPNGKMIATAGTDKVVNIWRAEDGLLLRSLEGHGGTVNRVAFTPDSRSVVSVSSDHNARLWDLDSGTLRKRFDGHTAAIRTVAISPDGRRLFTGGADRRGRVWDLDTGASIRTLTSFGSSVIAGAFSPDNRLLATGSEYHPPKIWDVSSGRLLHSLGRPGTLQDLTFVAGGKQLLTSHRDGWIRRWDTKTGESIDGGEDSFADTQLFLDVLPDDRLAVSGGRNNLVVIREGSSLDPLREYRGLVDPVTDVAISPDGKWFVAGSRSGAGVWDVGDLRGPTEQFEGHTGSIHTVAFSSDGRWLATTGADRTARVWEASSGNEIHMLAGPDGNRMHDAKFTADDRALITASGHEAQVWALPSGELGRTFEGHTNEIRGISVAPDGGRVATIAGNNIRIWNPATGEEISSFVGDPREVYQVAFFPDSRRLASCGAGEPWTVWNTDTAERLITLKYHTGRKTISVSADGATIMTSSGNGRIQLFDADTGKGRHHQVRDRMPRGASVYDHWEFAHKQAVVGAYFLGDGRRVVSAGSDGTIRLWYVDRVDSKLGFRAGETFSFDALGARINAIACSPDGRKIVAGGFDQKYGKAWIKIWDRGPLPEVE